MGFSETATICPAYSKNTFFSAFRKTYAVLRKFPVMLLTGPGEHTLKQGDRGTGKPTAVNCDCLAGHVSAIVRG